MAGKRIKILYFGTYSRGEEYARNLALINGLKGLGVELEECHTQLWPGFQDKMGAVKRGAASNLLALVKAYLRLVAQYSRAGRFDYLFVGYIGQFDVFLAYGLKLFHRKPIIFDAFYSLYDTMVRDRGLYADGSFMAQMLRLVDRWSVKCSDLALLDTDEHIKYFCSEFKLSPERFLSVPLGVDQDNFYPRPAPADDGVLEVLNYSSYIPLHGLDVILEAAALLRERNDIRFTLIGKGQLFPEMKALAEKLKLENVNFIEWLSHKELVEKAARADVLLGIFGVTEKASRVIPYKAYEALALGRPLVTGDSPASRELLVDGVHCLLTPMGDAKSLAEKIMRLQQDPALRKKIAENGRKIFEEKCSWSSIGGSILEKLREQFPIGEEKV
jgi:glycosyltransferase involved in cell wall biosynthesis